MSGEEEAAVVGLDGNVAAPIDEHEVRGRLGDNHPLLCKLSSANGATGEEIVLIFTKDRTKPSLFAARGRSRRCE